MKSATREVEEIAREIRAQFEKVKEKAAWVAVKQSELRPGDQISLFGLMEAQHELHVERSLLVGHAHMAQEMLHEKGIRPDTSFRRLLGEIRKLAVRDAAKFVFS